jgi:hypothetical protein
VQTEKILYPSLGIRLFIPLAGIAGIAAGWKAASNQIPKSPVLYSHSPLWWQGMGWFIIFCGAVWLVIGLVNLLPAATFLRLNAEGLGLSTIFYRQELEWGDVANFRLFQFNALRGTLRSSLRARTYVVADISSDAKRPPKGMEKMLRVYGCDFFFPSTFGMSAQHLADMLNEWRLNHSSRPTS